MTFVLLFTITKDEIYQKKRCVNEFFSNRHFKINLILIFEK